MMEDFRPQMGLLGPETQHMSMAAGMASELVPSSNSGINNPLDHYFKKGFTHLGRDSTEMPTLENNIGMMPQSNLFSRGEDLPM